jgi:S-formylglutathione hydrolase FrmB
MGGYGAFKLALRRPDMFAAAASLSGAMDIVRRAALHGDDLDSEFRRIFGDHVQGSDDDLFALLEQVSRSNGPKPKLYQCCGTEDFLYEENIRFKNVCEQTDLDYTYEEEPGEHEWGYWDKKIQDVLRWLPLKGRDA